MNRNYSDYTDLALEIKELAFSKSGDNTMDGIITSEEKTESLTISRMEIINENGSKLMGKPMGTYITAEFEGVLCDGDENFEDCIFVIAALIGELLPREKNAPILVAGLGNTKITPDGLGPLVTERVLVTRHITESKNSEFAELFRSVSAIRPGVLGQTGVESAEIIKGLLGTTKPVALVVVDALSARKLSRLGRTIQISNTGICPGAGIGNHRQEINEETMGVPVISIGVPTVISAATLVSDILEDAGADYDGEDFEIYRKLYVTPKDIDMLIESTAILLGYAINVALQNELSLADIRYYDGN